MYYCYILYSDKLDKYYIGYSNNIRSRLKKHNQSNKGFTAIGKPWELKYFEEFSTKAEAMHREKQLKNWKSRIRIEALIKE